MKRLLVVLTISSMCAGWSCSVSRHVDKTTDKEVKSEKIDSIVVKREATTVGEIKTDSSTIITVEHIVNEFSAPAKGDTLKKPIPLRQTIDRKTIEKRAVKEQKQTYIAKSDSTAKKIDSTDKKDVVTVKKDVEKTLFKVPWWLYFVAIGVVALAVFAGYRKFKNIT